MSGDDMVFEEVAFREPARLRRPDRDRRFACLAYEVPRPGDLPVFLDRKPADAIERHALRDTSVELGGILLGKECVDDETGEPFVWVTESLEAKHYENTQASFTYTHDSWEEITRERDKQFPDLDIVGWYHTHPDFGIFLSGHDLFIHHNFFDQPLQVAYVVDPIRQTRGFFRWRDGRMDQVGGYFLVADRGERVALSRLVNDLENIPNADGGGVGGLSPRLEAELIAMLSRPTQYASPPASQAAAAVFSLIGVVVGALCVAGWLWLQTMNHAIQAQAEETKALVKAIETRESAKDLATDLERVRAKESALDSLLSSVRVGDSAENIVGKFANIQVQLDETKRRLASKTAAADVLEAAAAQAKADKERFQSDLVYEKKKVEELKADVSKETDKLKREKGELQDQVRALKETMEDSETGLLARKYQYSWYAAVAGWVVSAGLAVGLLFATSRGVPVDDQAGPPRSPGDEPPHAIT